MSSSTMSFHLFIYFVDQTSTSTPSSAPSPAGMDENSYDSLSLWQDEKSCDSLSNSNSATASNDNTSADSKSKKKKLKKVCNEPMIKPSKICQHQWRKWDNLFVWFTNYQSSLGYGSHHMSFVLQRFWKVLTSVKKLLFSGVDEFETFYYLQV